MTTFNVKLTLRCVWFGREVVKREICERVREEQSKQETEKI